ncbi:MAG TPA: L,D-transpeptidase [Vicinamibacterales bacterium]|jgi:lipoprotein-anchoring transpeptidase ErfK/SrfK
MRTRTAAGLIAAVFVALSLQSWADAAPRATAQRSKTSKNTAKPASTVCGDLLGFQVLLDRQGFSPGQIDGKPGPNFSHALAALQTARGLSASGKPDCVTWKALTSEDRDSPITSYTLTAADLDGPFETKIPPRLDQQAALPALGYQSALEELAERFHASPALLQHLNPGLVLKAGHSIRVPAVAPFNPGLKPAVDPAAAGVTITVSRSDSSLRAARADGTIVFYAPVTTGSVHDPLPTGDYKVLGLSWRPSFHYNPDLFWDAQDGDEKATIKPGPNNPVGVVWIALNLEHYGLHGTPEPGRVGHAESHGCVRLTNWDAARVAALVRPGTPVEFR